MCEFELIMNVLQAGVADVDKANIEGNTPLHIACKTGPTELHMCLSTISLTLY